MQRLAKALALEELTLPEQERPCQFVTVKEAASLLQVSERTGLTASETASQRPFFLETA